ncbi:MAG: PHP domain-containing protein [Malacoplasma sp.]
MLKIEDKFLKCDLHMHSSSCYSRTYSKEDFINKLTENKLDVISITDHNVIDINLYQEIIENDLIKSYLIGGIELNISLSNEEIEKYSLSVKNNYFHAIIWCSIDDLNVLWTNLKKYMQNKFEDLKDIDNKSLSQIALLMKEKSFELDTLQIYLKDINYYFIFHENKGDRNLSQYLDNSDTNKKYKHRLFYYNNKLGLDGTKKNKKITNYFEENLNTIISSFLFSDAKEIIEIGEKFSWINFDGSFKNLILAMSDPESRIKTSEESVDNPQKNKNDYLESIKFEIRQRMKDLDDDGNIQFEKVIKEINFSPGLNGVIGSRGSGKSMLGNILGNKDLDKYKDYINIDSIQYKLKDSEYLKGAPKSKYLLQNKLLDIYESGNYMELDFVKNYYDQLLKDSKEKIKKTIGKIKNIIENDFICLIEFTNKYNNGIKSCDVLKNKPTSDTCIKDIDNFELPNNVNEKDIIKTNLNSINEELSKNIASFENIKFTKKFNESDELDEIIKEYKRIQIKLLSDAKKNNLEFIDVLNNYNYSKMNKRNSYLDNYKKAYNEINTKNNNIAKVFNDAYKDLLEYYSDFYVLRKQISVNYYNINNLYNSLFNDDLSKNLKLDNGETINISSTLEEQENFENFINSQFKNYENFANHISIILLRSNDEDKYKNLFSGQKYKSLSGIVNHLKRLQKNVNDYFDKFININLKIKYKEKDLKDFSPGKKSELLLEIFLCGDTINNDSYKYIILDQPEDNLDTNTIIKELVKKIRNMKLEKQVFVISHSAPIIINADSDIIICSKEENNNIDYLSGRINDGDVKQLIVETLDGGEKNLKMRLNKYDFNYEEEY